MLLLILGLAIVIGAHSLRIVAPSLRANLVSRSPAAYRVAHAVASLVGLVLVVQGFGLAAADPQIVYEPIFPLRAMTQVVMLPALILAVASVLPTGEIKRAVRHPLLIAVLLWSAGHLLANGDLAGVVLFGAFFVWAAVDLATVWRKPPAVPAGGASLRSDAIAAVAGIALYGALVAGLHAWLFGHIPT
jgi:uncharacterized membrane protein